MTRSAELRVPEIFRHEDDETYADNLLRDYCRNFDGHLFDSLGQKRNLGVGSCRVTSEDLLAVQMLSVKVPARAVKRILEDEAKIIKALLRRAPGPETPIWEVDEDQLTDEGAPLSCLWNLLRRNAGAPLRYDGKQSKVTGERDGMGPTLVSKLMARKRPGLIPISDGVVTTALGLPRSGEGHWLRARALMLENVTYQGEQMPLHERLERAVEKTESRVPITPLRALDIILWYANNPAPSTANLRAKVPRSR
ncbi:DUF6308 family protein [Actinomyces polynesiensis]|uniref:DUF6308 family protein n=1 Tax=Actinomyces polynesiensis TaxID=1325934 RepID=UPI00069360F4|nr:DUF6308 family protein [Actinomyces polynesiensis]